MCVRVCVCTHVCACMYVHACVPARWLQSFPALCDPMDCNRQAPLSMGFSRQEYWSGLPCPPSGDLPDPGIEPASPGFTCIGRFFTTSTTWETHIYIYIYIWWCKKIIFIYIRRGWRGETGKRKEAKTVMSSNQVYVRISPSGLLWESAKSSPRGCPHSGAETWVTHPLSHPQPRSLAEGCFRQEL